MRIIGITGGIGSGKSKVLEILDSHDYIYTIEADALAHRMFEPGEKVYENIVLSFGREILSSDGRIDRKVLAGIVMNDEKSLARLNAIVHPEVKEYIKHDIIRKNGDYKFYVIEAALLIQDGYKEICDEIWYIYADRQTRINRLMKWRGFTESKAIEYMNNQPDDAFFIENTDIVIDNSMDTFSDEEEGMKKLKASLEIALGRFRK